MERMKTLFKTYHNQKEIITKRKYLETKTGLKWQSYATGDGQRFVPIATKNTPLNYEAANKLDSYLTTKYRAFVDLANESGMNLADVVSGAWTLAKANRAILTVCRMGGAYAIRLKHKYEY